MDANKDIISRLPYGPQFLLIDAFELSEVSREMRTLKEYSATHPLIASHFKAGPPVVPGVLLVEQVCQSAFLLGITSGIIQSTLPPLLGEVKATFKRLAVAPCRLIAKVEIDAVLPNAFGFLGQVLNGEMEVCRVKGLCMVSQSI